jgi:hypothetical protein
MYMKNKNLGGKHWAELDFKVASDYTYGSPEYYRTLLRQMSGMPKLLPGESRENTKQTRPQQTSSNKVSNRRYM